jgi:hypothetical protein
VLNAQQLRDALCLDRMAVVKVGDKVVTQAIYNMETKVFTLKAEPPVESGKEDKK